MCGAEHDSRDVGPQHDDQRLPELKVRGGGEELVGRASSEGRGGDAKWCVWAGQVGAGQLMRLCSSHDYY